MNISSPKVLLHIEGLAVLTSACFVYHELGDSWLKFALLFLVPDAFMLGYVFGPRIGATIYNIGHTYFAPFLLWVLVYFVHQPSVVAICVVWIAHIGFDRLLGYGLKYATAFKDTHLSRI